MANAGQNRATTLLLWASGIVVIVLIVIGVRSLTREQVAVRVVPVSYQTLATTVATNGKVEPVDEFQVHAPSPGVVKQIFVQVGQKVSQGTLLVKMDDADARSRLATARAALENSLLIERDIESGGSPEDISRFKNELATATLDQRQATTDLATKQALFQKGSASQGEVAAAQQRLDAANLTLQERKVPHKQPIQLRRPSQCPGASRRCTSRCGIGREQPGQHRYPVIDWRVGLQHPRLSI